MNEIKKTTIQMVCEDCGKVTGTMYYYGANAPATMNSFCARGCQSLARQHKQENNPYTHKGYQSVYKILPRVKFFIYFIIYRRVGLLYVIGRCYAYSIERNKRKEN